ncbi:MAG: lysophospholipid acyltransferase family protein [Gemmatales bacterium]|nr:lysophospholipid acyltransferase family protein [Gemmatales bacterium]
MARKRQPVLDFLVYVIVRVVVLLLQSVPMRWAYAVGQALAELAHRVDRRHREAARLNLALAFPGRFSAAELDRLVRQVYRHFGEMLVECVLLARKLWPTTWRKYVELDDHAGLLARALLDRRPCLLLTAHYGNWELASYVLGLFGFRTWAIARPLDNPWLDRWVRRFRQRTGQKLLAKKGELERVRELLQSGATVAMLVDQDAGPRGLFVPFFGRWASTHKSAALLALEHGAVVLTVVARRIAPMRYRVEVGDVFYPEHYEACSRPHWELTRAFTASLEKLIRTDIRQYFWLHRRWKHQPRWAANAGEVIS